ncbi:redoxin domain-containing protein [Rhodoferax sp. AJA081-3]|nr:redoxin domain-containing protein [Rhodoferax sp. AJA081-3]QTN29394.1 redoxin domain-containing protein [Rhodoferax sp. AJA081-3]
MMTMKHTIVAVAALAASLAFVGHAHAQTQVGQPAPQFSAVDTAGKAVSLADFKGKYVVLEWTNPECPFVQKHYTSGNMQATQKHAASKGVVWLQVNTTGGSEKDSKLAAELAQWFKDQKTTAQALLMDGGKLGQAFGAKTTPHMYLIDPAGKLVYAGAIDSKASANPGDIATATNYVTQAINETAAGKPVSKPVTGAYGCSVKYASAG